MSIYTIYRITNSVNGKVYIGFTSKTPEVRWKQHIKIGKNTKDDNHEYIHRAMNKYGVDKFVFDAIYQSTDGDHCLKVMESHFIKEYGSFGTGYNLTQGGEKPPSQKGVKKTAEHRAKIAAAHKGKTQIGTPHTEEHKTRLKERMSQLWTVTHPDGTEELVKGMVDFCTKHGLQPSKMSLVAKGYRTHHKGFVCAKYSEVLTYN